MAPNPVTASAVPGAPSAPERTDPEQLAYAFSLLETLEPGINPGSHLLRVACSGTEMHVRGHEPDGIHWRELTVDEAAAMPLCRGCAHQQSGIELLAQLRDPALLEAVSELHATWRLRPDFDLGKIVDENAEYEKVFSLLYEYEQYADDVLDELTQCVGGEIDPRYDQVVRDSATNLRAMITEVHAGTIASEKLRSVVREGVGKILPGLGGDTGDTLLALASSWLPGSLSPQIADTEEKAQAAAMLLAQYDGPETYTARVVTLPRWVAEALGELAPRLLLSTVLPPLDPQLVDAAKVLWQPDSDGPLRSFDAALEAIRLV